MARQGPSKPITAKAFLLVFWRVLFAYGFYPLMLGLFLWGLYKGYHWSYGAALLAAIFWLDPIWRVLLRRIMDLIKR